MKQVIRQKHNYRGVYLDSKIVLTTKTMLMDTRKFSLSSFAITGLHKIMFIRLLTLRRR